MPERVNIAVFVGRRTIESIKGIRKFQKFIKSIIISFKSFKYLRYRSIHDIIINQTKFTGIDALPFVIFIALILGGTVIVQAITKMPKMGVEGFIGNLLIIIVARELGPLVTALIVISRSGSAMTTEIATQKQNKEILAMEIMGIDTRLYIVFPRIIASILSIFSLIIIFDIVAFVGGYMISRMIVFIPVKSFIQTLIDAFSFKDLISTLLKSFVYGILIPVICCYYGFRPRSKFEIPIFVSRAVIRTLFIIFVVNALTSAIFYF
ncbi:ABC transporter permease [Spirochaetota bacterium]